MKKEEEALDAQSHVLVKVSDKKTGDDASDNMQSGYNTLAAAADVT